MAFADTAGLIFRIDVDGTQTAINEFGRLDRAIGGINVGRLSAATAIGATALASLGAAAVGAAGALFGLTRQSAEYGSTIFDATQKTGLSAAAISLLAVSAENAGSSLEQVTSGTAKFAKTLGEARDGNEKAQRSLAALNVTTFDLDEALSQATKTIFAAKDGTDQIVLAQKAFGKSGADLIPVIKQFGGDLAAAQKEAERLGTTLTEKDIAASDAFGDSLGVLSAQAKAAGVAFTSDLMVVLAEYFTSASQWYANNKDEVRSWGSTIANTLRGSVLLFKDFDNASNKALEANGIYLRKNADGTKTWADSVVSNVMRATLAWTTFGVTEFFRAANARGELASSADSNVSTLLGGTSVFSFPKGGGGAPSRGGGGGADKAKSEADRLAREAEQRRRDDIAAEEKSIQRKLQLFRKKAEEELQILDNRLAREEISEKEHAETVRKIKENEARYEAILLKKFSQNALLNDKERAEAVHQLSLAELQVKIEILETTLAIGNEDKKLAEERLSIARKLKEDLIAVNEELQSSYIESEEETWDQLIEDAKGFLVIQNDLRREAEVAMTTILTNERDRRIGLINDEYDARKKEIEDAVKDEEERQKLLFDLDELYKQKRLLSEEEFQKQLREIQDKYAFGVEGGEEDKGYGPFQSLIDSWTRFRDQVLADAPTLGQTMQAIGGLFVGAFESMTQAIGGLIQNWVLMGTTGPAALRKILAATLAALAAEAGVRAIFELAMGFASLFFNPAKAAAHFQAAALFGSIAVGAALAGRAAAGNLFQQQTGGAAGASASSGGGSPGRGGGAFSSQGEQNITQGINAPSGGIGTMVIRDKSGMFDQLFEIAWEGNGRMRQRMQAEFGK